MQILIRDLIFLNYALPPERARSFVPEELELDTRRDDSGNDLAFISVVPFNVAEVRTSLLPLPRLVFSQINYRTYVKSDEGPAVYFFDLRVNSRMVATSAGFLGLPLNYEAIEINSTEGGAEAIEPRCSVDEEGDQGVKAELIIGERLEAVGRPGQQVSPDFFTERPIGFVSAAAGGILKLPVEHRRMEALSAQAVSVNAPRLESLGLLGPGESAGPHSLLYVPEILFDASTPAPWLPPEQ